MRKIAVLLTAVLLTVCIASASYAATMAYPFSVTHRFHDGLNYNTVVKTVTDTLMLADGEEFWLENLSGSGQTYVYNYPVDGYENGRWWNNMSTIGGGSGAVSYGGIDADGKYFMYKNRYIALPVNNGYAEYDYTFMPSLTRYYVDQNGDPLTGQGGTLKDKAGNTVPNPGITYYFQGTAGNLKVPEIPGYALRPETQEGDPITWNAANQCWVVHIDLSGDGYGLTFVYDKLYTVTYTDGAGGKVFPDQVAEDIPAGDPTPAFDGGTPKREGYVFSGWSPSVSATVQGDAVYTAQWKAQAGYTVTYTDGADGKVFPDQVTENLAKGADTPAFTGGKPQREGWKFKGWSPQVSEKVQGNATYTAKWEKETVPAVPVTGDDTALAAFGLLMSGSLIGMALLLKRRKKN